MTLEIVIALIVALLAGAALGWFMANRRVHDLRTERDKREADFKAAIVDLAAAEERAREIPELRDQLDAIRDERDVARLHLTELRAKAGGFEEPLGEFKAGRDAMAGKFRETASQMLTETQEAFLKRAEDRFKQSETTAG